ncbi:hypothetical protein AAF987_004431 [Escherichia coli]|mgnify:CR=1 FL=1|jgi:hypothetical protein
MTEPTRPILTIKRRNRTVYVPPEKTAKSEPQPAEQATSKAKVQPKGKAPQKPAQEPTTAKAKKTPEQVAEGIRRGEENNRRQQEEAIARKSGRALGNKVTKQFLREHWPDILERGIQGRPFAKGMLELILARGAEIGMPPEMTGKAVRRVLGMISDSASYQKALIGQSMRYDLDGNPTVDVTPEEAEQARVRLKAIQKRRAEERARVREKHEKKGA